MFPIPIKTRVHFEWQSVNDRCPQLKILFDFFSEPLKSSPHFHCIIILIIFSLWNTTHTRILENTASYPTVHFASTLLSLLNSYGAYGSNWGALIRQTLKETLCITEKSGLSPRIPWNSKWGTSEEKVTECGSINSLLLSNIDPPISFLYRMRHIMDFFERNIKNKSLSTFPSTSYRCHWLKNWTIILYFLSNNSFITEPIHTLNYAHGPFSK